MKTAWFRHNKGNRYPRQARGVPVRDICRFAGGTLVLGLFLLEMYLLVLLGSGLLPI